MNFDLQHVSIHGHDIGYRMAGEGPALLMIHGIAGSSRAWREVMPTLAHDYTVIAPDLIGHGRSAKPVGDYSLGAYASGMRDLLGVLGVERATMVGQSFGGGVALHLAFQHPECCERLVLVDSGGLGREVSWVLRLMTLPGTEFIMPALFPTLVRERGNDISRMLHNRGVRMARIGEMWSAYASLTESANRQAFVRTIRAVIDPGGQTVSAMDRLHLAAQIPTLIVWGGQRHDHSCQPRLRRPRGHPGQPPRDHRRLRALPARGGSRTLPPIAPGIPRNHRAVALRREGPPRRPGEPSLRLTCRHRASHPIPLAIAFP
jgi:pimeloyl-ACP methyl ester carboxylesterase